MSLVPGARLGAYEIVSLVGAGGMGEVYRARDPRLGRDVALKVLPTAFSADPDRLRRFEQEARAAAALNHPNILTLHEIGTHNGQSYVVSELLEGQTLRQALADGALPIRKAVDYAVQICHGLAAAYERGIVHRDLKPENVFVTRDGRVKILDFGVAKLTERGAAVAGAGATIVPTQAADTTPGLVLGTAGYMSPEQVRGHAVDHRSDIFSFGLIVYELLSGKRAFTGDTSVETMTAILRHDLPELPETIPGGLRQIVAHCVEKDPAQRFQSARDLAFALSQSGVTTGVARAVEAPSRSWWVRWGLTAMGALALVALTASADRWLWRAPDPPAWSGVLLAGPQIAIGPRLSPDGLLLAFQAMDHGLTQVAVMKPESGNWSILTHSRDRGMVSQVNWSRDGTLIYYDRYTGVPAGIYSVPVLGGDEHLVLENAGSPVPLADGTLLIVHLNSAQQFQYGRYWPETGRLLELPVLAGQGDNPNFFTGGGTNDTALLPGTAIDPPGQPPGLFALDLRSNTVRRFTPGMLSPMTLRSYSFTRDGRSVVMALSSDATVRLVSAPARGRFEARTLFTVTSDVWGVDTASDGSVYVNLVDRPLTLVRLALNGEAQQLASFPLVPDFASVLMLPDGRAVVPVRASGQRRLMVVDRGKEPVPLINTVDESDAPMTTVGSREIAFAIGPSPRQAIAIADIESGRIKRRLVPGKGRISSVACSPDGRTLFFSTNDTVWAIPVLGGEARQFAAGYGVMWDASRHSLIVVRLENSRERLFRLPLNGGPEEEIVIDESVPVIVTGRRGTDALDARGRLLVSLQLRDSWFNPLGILDTLTGHIERLPVDTLSDHLSAAWTADGHIVSVQQGLRATMWRFRPESR